MLEEYQQPRLEEATREELEAYVRKRKEAIGDREPRHVPRGDMTNWLSRQPASSPVTAGAGRNGTEWRSVLQPADLGEAAGLHGIASAAGYAGCGQSVTQHPVMHAGGLEHDEIATAIGPVPASKTSSWSLATSHPM